MFRAGAGPDLTQPVTAKLALGYDFSGIDSTVTVTDSGISLVTDSSGNGNDGTQANDARRLLYGSATINGRPAADTGGNLNAFVGMPSTITNFPQEGQPPYHLFAVFQATTWAASNLFSFQNNGGAVRSGFRLSTSGGNRVEARVPAAGPSHLSVLSTQTTLATGTTYVAELITDGLGNAGLYVNNGTPALQLGSVIDTGESFANRRFVGDFGGASDAKIGAVYIFNEQLSVPERAEWHAFLGQRWGVTL